MELDPELGRNLQKMANFDGDVEATFGQVFQVSYEVRRPEDQRAAVGLLLKGGFCLSLS